MEDVRVEINLIPSPDDPPAESPEYQDELNRFADGVQDKDRPVSSTVELIEASGVETVLLGGFFFVLGSLKPAAPIIAAWIRSRSGRKVSMKVGGDEFQASTPEELEKVIDLAEKYKRNTEPKRIYEP
jgi:hypothetical protein